MNFGRPKLLEYGDVVYHERAMRGAVRQDGKEKKCLAFVIHKNLIQVVIIAYHDWTSTLHAAKNKLMTKTFVTGHMISLIQILQSAPHMSAPALQRTVDQTAAPLAYGSNEHLLC